MKTVTIQIPENTELVKTETGYEVRVLDEEKKWEDFGDVDGYFVNNHSRLAHYQRDVCYHYNRNTFPTEKEAEIYGIIMPQLLQWRDKVNKGCKFDWEDLKQPKWCIIQNQIAILVSCMYTSYYPLHFQTKEIAEQFYKDHKALIDKLIQ